MASLKDIKVNINVDTTDFIKSLRQLQESIKMDNVRILKGWTEKEQAELEEAKDNDFNSAIDLINGIVDEEDDCIALTGKYMNESSDENNQLARDIADYYAGAAKFPVRMYKVTLPDGNYLVKDKIDGNRWMFTYSNRDGYNLMHSTYDENTFTRKEIENINPIYMAFAVPVEDDDEI